MRKLLLWVVVFGLASPALADDAAKRRSIDELMRLTNAESLIDAVYAQTEQMLAHMTRELDLRESERPIYEKHMRRLGQLMREEMSWAKMKEPLIAIYMKHYSEKEIDDLLAFYRSDTGRKMIEKMPLVMQESMLLSQDMLKSFMPKMSGVMKEMEQEVRLARKN